MFPLSFETFPEIFGAFPFLKKLILVEVLPLFLGVSVFQKVCKLHLVEAFPLIKTPLKT